MDHHFRVYRSKLLRGESDQPFFYFLIDLVNNTTVPLLNDTYEAVLEWVYEKCPSCMDTWEEETMPKGLLPPVQDNLSTRQIALLYIYQGKEIGTGYQAVEIAKKYGKIMPSSGRQLREDFLFFKEPEQRTNSDGEKARALIRDIEKVKQRLDGEGLKKAKEELNELKMKFL